MTVDDEINEYFNGDSNITRNDINKDNKINITFLNRFLL